MNVYLDFETRSDVDLRKHGAYSYAMDPSTKVIITAFAKGDDPVSSVAGFPELVREMLEAPDARIVAHNAAFERLILKHVLGLDYPPSKFICTAEQCRALQLPYSLEVACRMVLGTGKLASGKRLIQKFCIPPHAVPAEHVEDWNEFVDYAKVDVEQCRRLYAALPEMSDVHKRNYEVSESINDAGLPVDLDLARRCAERALEKQHDAQVRVTELTKGAIGTARGVRLTKWIHERLPESAKSLMVLSLIHISEPTRPY